ncbi:hypothetical protein K1T73_00400 [Roseovarius sp. SCSIO 43702]|uniref:hypothetical protein n=1 Tax=Roseovarius sp. SCSIO 43702 TaxID=2823043 RepID=UPI001C72B8D1|nr:hypothetical protein [Roseovarius sp. SCSIO 43702]QYX56916.1 hypothetical protein K1T73_00400 [Roseovarius sp. SCSIO 43702]
MQIEKIEFDQVRYNPEVGAFETLIRVREEGRTYSYPTSVTATLYEEFDVIARRLTERAAKAHRAKVPGLHASRPTTSADYQARVAEILADGTIWPRRGGPRIAA